MKILAVVKFNDGIAMVFDELPQFLYTQHNSCLIGTAGIFFDFLVYERPSARWQAFAGREFKLPLKDGGVVECRGQWWDGRNKESYDIIKEDLVRITCGTANELKKCYVFHSRSAVRSGINQLLKEYKGPIYKYWDYQEILNGKATRETFKKYRIRRRKPIFTKKKQAK